MICTNSAETFSTLSCSAAHLNETQPDTHKPLETQVSCSAPFKLLFQLYVFFTFALFLWRNQNRSSRKAQCVKELNMAMRAVREQWRDSSLAQLLWRHSLSDGTGEEGQRRRPHKATMPSHCSLPNSVWHTEASGAWAGGTAENGYLWRLKIKSNHVRGQQKMMWNSKQVLKRFHIFDITPNKQHHQLFQPSMY